MDRATPLGTVVFLLGLVLSPLGSVDLPFIYQANALRTRVNLVPLAPQEADVEDSVYHDFTFNRLIRAGVVDLAQHQYTVGLLLRVTAENADALLKFAAQSDALFFNEAILSEEERQNVIEFARSLTPSEISACCTADCIHWILSQDLIFSHLNDSARKALTGQQLLLVLGRRLLKLRKRGYPPAGALEALHPLLRRKYAGLILEKFGEILLGISKAVAMDLLADPASCAHLSPSLLKYLLNTTDLAALLSPECLRIAHHQLGSIPGKLMIPAESLGPLNLSLHPVTVRTLSPEQVRCYASRLEPNDLPGRNLALSELSEASLPLVSPKLFVGWLHANQEPTLHESAKHLPPNMLDSLSWEDSVTALGHFAGRSTSLLHVPVDWIKSIVTRFPHSCNVIPPEVDWSRITMHSPECFRFLPPPTQAAVLVSSSHLPEDLLKHVSAEQVRGWIYHGQVQFSVMNLIRDPSKRAALWRRLGEDPDGEDPCSLLPEEWDEFLALQGLHETITTHCFNAVQREWPVDEEERRRIPPRLFLLRPVHQLISGESEEFFTHMDVSTLRHLISGGLFARQIPEEYIEYIPQATLAALSANEARLFSRGAKADRVPGDPIAPSLLATDLSESMSRGMMGWGILIIFLLVLAVHGYFARIKRAPSARQ